MRVSNVVLRRNSVNVFLFKSLPHDFVCVCLRSGRTFFTYEWTGVNAHKRYKLKIQATAVLQYNNSSAIKMNFIFVNKCHIYVAYRSEEKHTNTFPFTSTSFWFEALTLSLSLSVCLVLLNFKCNFIRTQNGLPLCTRFDSFKKCIQYHFYSFTEKKIFFSKSFFTENSQGFNVGLDYINSIHNGREKV